VRRPWILIAAGGIVAAMTVLLYAVTRGEYQAPPQRPAPALDSRPGTARSSAALPQASPLAVAPDANTARDADALAARDAREELLARVRASGDARESWDGQAKALFDAAGGAVAADVGCYVAGCAAELTFPSRDRYARSIDALQGSDAYQAWTGGKVLSPPEVRDDGSVVVAIVLYRPD
jgi:hypothetical protein